MTDNNNNNSNKHEAELANEISQDLGEDLASSLNNAGFDISSMVAQAQQMEQKMLASQAAQEQLRLVGSAANGRIQITSNGIGQFLDVKIDPSVIDMSDISVLQDYLLIALQEVNNKVDVVQAKAIEELDLPGDFPM